MANLEKYKGVIPAFYACYDAEGNVSPERVRALTEYQIRKGVKGVYVNGTSGACNYPSLEDRKITLERVIGAEAVIGGTYGVMPELFLKMDELVKAGKMEEAMKVQYAANDIIYKMCSGHGNMYGMIKEMLRINESLDLGGVREPLPQLIESDLAIAQEAARMVKEAVAAYC